MNTTNNIMTVTIKITIKITITTMNDTVIDIVMNVSTIKINIVQNNKRIMSYCFE